MQSEVVVAVVSAASALGGAVIGGVASYTGQRLGIKTSQQHELALREDALIQQRREAYARFLSNVDGFSDAARAVCAAVDARAGEIRCDEAQVRHEQAWTRMVESMAAVQMIAPYEIGESAADVYSAAAYYSNAVDDRHRGKRWTEAFNKLPERLIEARRDFTKAVLTSQGLLVREGTDSST